MTVLLVVLAVAFAYSMGAHYTGACMGMPHALGAVSATRALLVMAPLTLLGAALASHKVEVTVGHNLLVGEGLSVTGLVVVIAVAFGLTSLFNVLRIPTSTIQILVFTVVGAGLAAGTGIHWAAIAALAVIWVCAPPAAALLGFALTRVLDLVPSLRAHTAAAAARTAVGPLAAGLVAVGALASFAMGGNDVANATGSLVGTGTFGPAVAGLVGGLGLAAGVLTWGRPLLTKVAFDLVTVDRPMATAAQLVQAAVVLAAVAFGFFTSMNQALIGAMTGAGAARGRHTVHAAALWGVLRGWVVGPGAGIALGYACSWLVAAAAGAHVLLAG
ncbi:MAG TPA: inorganic phosphate transporter [Motilibacteraceae bacterium]|nr:inorganic phosphate transporter [Motilibacteraceae bacterium]